MNLISKEAAADLMDVPVSWVNGMIERGMLEKHNQNGMELVDADNMVVRRYASKEFESSSSEHIQSLLRNYSIESKR